MSRPIWERLPPINPGGGRLCCLPGCGKKHHMHNMCNTHVRAMMRNALDPETGELRSRVEAGVSVISDESRHPWKFGAYTDWAWIGMQSALIHRETAHLVPIAVAAETWGPRVRKAVRTGRIERFENIGFSPTPLDPSLFNTYRPLASMMPSETPTALRPEVRELLDNLGGQHTRYLEQWLAWGIQTPGEWSVSLVLHGVQGSGKGVLHKLLHAVFGEYFGVAKNESFNTNFNGWLERKLLINADEVGNEDMRIQRRYARLLKSYTVPGRIQINAKGRPQYDVDNISRWLFTSNDKLPILLDKDDRRYSVIHTPQPLRPETGQVIAARIKEMAQSMVDHLFSTNLSGFDPARPLENEARGAVKARSGAASWEADDDAGVVIPLQKTQNAGPQ